jgi:HlyD family secretion protein
VLKRIIFGVLAVALAGLIAFASRPKPPELQTALVAFGPLRVTVDEHGKTRIRERYTIPAPAAGTLSRVELRAGDPVESNTVIAELLPLPSPLLDSRAREVAEQQLASARDSERQSASSITRAEAAVQLASSTLTRERRLVAEGTVGSAELEQAEADAHMKDSELQSLRFAEQVAAHGVTQAQATLTRFGLKPGTVEHLEITSPVHGRVLHVLHEDAGPVTAGTAIIEVGDLGSMDIVAELLSQDAVSVQPGMPATLAHWGGADIPARVRRIEPAGFTKLSALGVEEQRVNVLLDVVNPATAATLGDAFAVEVSILTWESDRVLQVPTSALFRNGQGWAVFILTGGHAALRQLQIGHRAPLHAEVTGGVVEGDEVVAHPPSSLKDGDRIRGTRQ